MECYRAMKKNELELIFKSCTVFRGSGGGDGGGCVGSCGGDGNGSNNSNSSSSNSTRVSLSKQS